MISKDAIKGKISELYQFRHLYYSLVKKNLFGKYKNSALGFLWNFITPAISVLLFYIVFENFMGRGMEHFWAYLCIGMFPFTFMNTNLINGASNITSNGGMIKKMYFPREVLPLAQVTYTFIVFLIAYAIVAVLMILVGYPLRLEAMLFLPLAILTMFIFSFGAILFTSAISVYSRDFEYFISAASRILFWVTPIFYVTREMTGIIGKLIWFNPLTYYVEIFHDIMYWGVMPSNELIIACVAISLAMFIIGAYVFLKLKDGFAERI